MICVIIKSLFGKVVVSNPELCRHMLELILGTAIRKINISAAEHVMDITADAGTVYDLEMQTAAKKNLPRRLRYYQGVIDLNLIEKGDDYDQLPESVVVFICTFDYFGECGTFFRLYQR